MTEPVTDRRFPPPWSVEGQAVPLIAVLFIPAPTAQAQGLGGSGTVRSKYVCKSGHNVQNPKGCKENGGKW
jgi:hypothetical protein